MGKGKKVFIVGLASLIVAYGSLALTGGIDLTNKDYVYSFDSSGEVLSEVQIPESLAIEDINNNTVKIDDNAEVFVMSASDNASLGDSQSNTSEKQQEVGNFISAITNGFYDYYKAEYDWCSMPSEEKYPVLKQLTSKEIVYDENCGHWNKKSLLMEDVLNRDDINLKPSAYNNNADCIKYIEYAFATGKQIVIDGSQYTGDMQSLYVRMFNNYYMAINNNFAYFSEGIFPSASSKTPHPVSYDQSSKSIVITPNIASTSEEINRHNQSVAKIREICDNIAKTTSPDATEKSVALRLFSAIVDNTNYATGSVSDESYGAVISGNAKCSGISSALITGLNILGIKATAVLSNEHAWVQTELDGKMYMMDGAVYKNATGARKDILKLSETEVFMDSNNAKSYNTNGICDYAKEWDLYDNQIYSIGRFSAYKQIVFDNYNGILELKEDLENDNNPDE